MIDDFEEWRFIEGYDFIYEVSSKGRIRKNGIKIIKTFSNRDGYSIFTLQLNKVRKTMYVHRVVAIEFVPNPFNKPQVNHINSIRSDNDFCNLEWVTIKENSIHSIDFGNYKPKDSYLIKIYNNEKNLRSR